MIKRIFRNLYFLTFLNGFLIASLFYFSMEANYDRELFAAIQYNVKSKINRAEPDDSVAVKAMHACNALLSSRSLVFGDQTFDGIKADYINPTSIDLMTARGACGSYAIVLTRVLENYHYPVRIAQMKVKGVYAAHNVVEAMTGHGWVVLDPLFNVYFVKPDKKGLASFADVQNNWDYYKNQVPPGYNPDYRYEGVRYSNWQKIPIILPAVKKIFDGVLGKEKADKISIRTYFLRTYDVYFYVLLVLYIPLFIFTVKKLIQTKIFPQPNIPFTFPNVLRYARARILHKGFESSVNS